MPKRAARGKKTKAGKPTSSQTRRGKQTLRPEQLLQEAAIEEIEALLNEDVTVSTLQEGLAGKQARRQVQVKSNKRSHSPYVVDLKQALHSPSDAPTAPNTAIVSPGVTARLSSWFARRRVAADTTAAGAMPISVRPALMHGLARRAAAVHGVARMLRDPLTFLEPYSSDITALWLLRIAWMLVTLPLAVAARMAQVAWQWGSGYERLQRAEAAVRLATRGFWIAGGVVTHAAVAAGREVVVEGMRGAARALRRLVARVPRRLMARPHLALRASRSEKPKKEKQPRQPKQWMPWQALQRRLAAFVVMAAVVIIPLKLAGYFGVAGAVKGVVLGESEEAVDYLETALANGRALSFTDAAADFGSAAQSFANARASLNSYATAIAVADTIPLRQAQAPKAVERLLRSGEAASRGAYHLSLAVDALELTPAHAATTSTATQAPLTDRIAAFRSEAQQAHAALAEVTREITELNPSVVAHLPAAQAATIAEQIAHMQRQAGTLEDGLSEIMAVAEFFQTFLGDERDMRYLVVFQNNAEMRASGGFIGSFALADFRQGKLKQLEVPGGGSYDLQGGLHTRVSAPQPLHLINSLWEFQDANWWPDWPTSAKKLEWFFVNGWGSSVDGVIALTPTVMEDVLRVIGPIDMEADYGVTVTADNLYTLLQDREDLADESKPKAIIRDLAARMIEEMPARLSWEKLVALAGVMNKGLASKQLLLHFDDESLQQFVDERNWGGRIQEAEGDYLMVVNTNIAGGKSDRAIRQHIQHNADITPDGSITVTVTITREHTAERGDPFTGVRNVDYMRVYVPLGSQLLSAHGFQTPDSIYFDEPAAGAQPDYDLATEREAKVDEQSGVRMYAEAGKTVFAHWSQVDPGEKTELVLKYKLPFKLHGVKETSFDWQTFMRGYGDISPYSLTWQKQPGDVYTTYATQLHLPSDREVLWPKPSDTPGVFINGWELEGALDTDKYWGAAVEKH